MMKTNEEYMRMALELAYEAYDNKETPVGCIITDAGGNVIGRGQNRRETAKDAAAHAELDAIRDACRHLGGWRLNGCSLYVTLEPCPMCAGAVIMSRIDNLFYGAKEPLTGACGSVINLFMEPFGQKTRVTGNILGDECSALLGSFFKNLRE